MTRANDGMCVINCCIIADEIQSLFRMIDEKILIIIINTTISLQKSFIRRQVKKKYTVAHHDRVHDVGKQVNTTRHTKTYQSKAKRNNNEKKTYTKEQQQQIAVLYIYKY